MAESSVPDITLQIMESFGENTTMNIVESSFFLSSMLFIFALGALSNQETGKKGNFYGMVGMFLCILMTFFTDDFFGMDYQKFILAAALGGFIGVYFAYRVEMIDMPQLVAILHSFVGLAATIVGFASNMRLEQIHAIEETEISAIHKIETFLAIFIGALTFTGSVVAWGKLDGKIGSEPLLLCGKFRHWLNALNIGVCCFLAYGFIISSNQMYLIIMCGLSGFLGWALVMGIGGADMPVVVSMLNSYSGWTTSCAGFMINNNLLIISGALIGSSGAILSYIMCKAMNRSFISVILGGFGVEASEPTVLRSSLKITEVETKDVTQSLLNAKKIIIVPGYGMAVSKAQHVVGILVDKLRKLGKHCHFCIHPVAGRLPGHMNVLLAECNVPYDIVKEMDEINEEFKSTDVVLVVGANDVVNPDALENTKSPIYGMPVCKVWESKQVFVIKRGMGKGYAAIENMLFYKPNCGMFFGSAQVKVNEVLAELAEKQGQKIDPQAKEIELQKKKKKVEEKNESDEEFNYQQLYNTQQFYRTIGVPKEVYPGEKRVALVPTHCGNLLKKGFKIKVESGAGELAGFTDRDYIKHGCQIVDTKELWENTEVIIKVRAPMENFNLGCHEADSMENTTLLISQIFPVQNEELVNKLCQRHQERLSVLALDRVPRITRAQKLDTLSSQANLAGYKAVLEAFNLFPKFSKQYVSAAGSVPPATVLILGTGVAGLSAIGTAKCLGAIVKATDVRSAAKEQVESLGGEFLIPEIEETEGAGVGGYAKEMSPEYMAAQKKMTLEAAKKSDIVITTALIPGRKAPILITKECIEQMKKTSVLVDMAAEMGGNCELTQPGEVYTHTNGVRIIGYYDYPARMSVQSSFLFSTNMCHLIDEIIGAPLNKQNTAKDWNLNFKDEIIEGLACIIQGESQVNKIKQQLGMIKPPEPQKQEESSESQVLTISKKESKSKGSKKDTKKKKASKKKEEVKPEKKLSVKEKQQRDSISLTKSLHEKARLEEQKQANLQKLLGIVGSVTLMILIGKYTDQIFIFRFGLFILAIYAGYNVIWNVTAALHTPLMAVTNAISGVIVVACMVTISQPIRPIDGSFNFTLFSFLATAGVFFASINIFGGFFVTQRMLNMFKK